jgi:hypothetical protein
MEGFEPKARIHNELNLDSVTITDSCARNCGRASLRRNTGYTDMHFKLTAYSTVVLEADSNSISRQRQKTVTFLFKKPAKQEPKFTMPSLEQRPYKEKVRYSGNNSLPLVLIVSQQVTGKLVYLLPGKCRQELKNETKYCQNI